MNVSKYLNGIKTMFLITLLILLFLILSIIYIFETIHNYFGTFENPFEVRMISYLSFIFILISTTMIYQYYRKSKTNSILNNPTISIYEASISKFLEGFIHGFSKRNTSSKFTR